LDVGLLFFEIAGRLFLLSFIEIKKAAILMCEKKDVEKTNLGIDGLKS